MPGKFETRDYLDHHKWPFERYHDLPTSRTLYFKDVRAQVNSLLRRPLRRIVSRAASNRIEGNWCALSSSGLAAFQLYAFVDRARLESCAMSITDDTANRFVQVYLALPPISPSSESWIILQVRTPAITRRTRPAYRFSDSTFAKVGNQHRYGRDKSSSEVHWLLLNLPIACNTVFRETRNIDSSCNFFVGQSGKIAFLSKFSLLSRRYQ